MEWIISVPVLATLVVLILVWLGDRADGSLPQYLSERNERLRREKR
jgi:hypothetical protein